MSQRRKTVPPTQKRSRSSSSGRKELIAREKTEKQSARKRTALDNRFHRTLSATAFSLADHKIDVRACRLQQRVKLLDRRYRIAALVARICVPGGLAEPQSNIAQRRAARSSPAPQQQRRHRRWITAADLECRLVGRKYFDVETFPVDHGFEPIPNHAQRFALRLALGHAVEQWNLRQPEPAVSR